MTAQAITAPTISLAALNEGTQDGFVQALGAIFEHAPWVARIAHAAKPFADADALFRAMWQAVDATDPATKLALLRGHPELARARLETLTAHSRAEQQGAGLAGLSPQEAAAFDAANTAYRDRFGFPFIIAVRGVTNRAQILAAMQARLLHAPEDELPVALQEVGRIARFRLQDLVAGSAVLTTHVLDTAQGRPAVGLALQLARLDGEQAAVLGRFVTNQDGRTDAPLLQGADLQPGVYQLLFHVGAWRAAQGGEGGFYEDVPVRFRIAAATGKFHVPLILSPFGYSTYRGS